jgi:hypothetical protein
MRRKRTVDRVEAAAAVGCETCLERGSCERAQEGTFCGKWHSREVVRKPEEDPNRKWEAGEEVDF